MRSGPEIVGRKKYEESKQFRTLHNEKSLDLYRSPAVDHVQKSRGLRWARG